MAKDNSLSEKEFVEQAILDCPDFFDPSNRAIVGQDVLNACEAYYMNGCFDELSGDSEAPTGHFYRIHRFIVTTFSDGSRYLNTLDNEDEATKEFK
ncbi:MAG: hypothetical protein H0U23_04800, partial [Blastocatellia bacterium]|nr:hypothetical protein [Blastocatellia bacterium]